MGRKVKKGGSKSGGKKRGASATAGSSDSDNDHYGGDDFDPKNPFGDDAMENFHSSRDKV